MGREDTGLVCGAPRTSLGQRFAQGMKIYARDVFYMTSLFNGSEN